MSHLTSEAGSNRKAGRANAPLAGGLDHHREPKPRHERTAKAGPAHERHSGAGCDGEYYEFYCTEWFMPEPEGAANDSRTRWSTGRTDE